MSADREQDTSPDGDENDGARDPSDVESIDAERDDGDDRFPSVDNLIGTFLGEASLWPVLVVMLASAGAFGATILVLTVIDHNPFAAAALVLLLGMTADVLIRSRRVPGLRNVARMIALIWGVAGALAILGVWTGIAT